MLDNSMCFFLNHLRCFEAHLELESLLYNPFSVTKGSWGQNCVRMLANVSRHIEETCGEKGVNTEVYLSHLLKSACIECIFRGQVGMQGQLLQ